MKSKIALVLIMVMLTLGSLPLSTVKADNSEGVPPPTFVNITVDGEVPTQNRVAKNSTVKIEYTAERNEVDGLLLLGTGSGLTENITAAEEGNFTFTLDRTFRNDKFFSFELVVTQFTKFYAWAWKDNITNGVREEFETPEQDLEGGAYHHIWISEDLRTPSIFSVVNATTSELGYQTQRNGNVTIKYRVSSPTNTTEDRSLTISFSDNETNVLNASTSQRLSMTWISWDISTQFHLFEINYTLASRVIFFSTYNARGWERNVPDEAIIHRLHDSFSFNSTYSNLDVGNFTDIDDITVNVTSYNQTNDDTFYMRYRFGNESVDLDELNWTEVQLTNIVPPTIKNASISNTTEAVYQFVLGQTLNVTDQIELQAFVRYRNLTDYLEAKVFTISDSKPRVGIFLNDVLYINSDTVTISYNVTNIKGDLKTVELRYGLNSTSTNSTLDVIGENDLSVRANTTITLNSEGIYRVSIFAENTFNRSSEVTGYIHLDQTAPELAANVDNSTSNLSTGFVLLTFDITDNAGNDSGLERVLIDWGDGLLEELIDLNSTSIKHNYARNGEYEIFIEVFDKAGNSNNLTITVQIQLSAENTTNNANTPFPFIAFLSILALPLLRRRK